MASKKKSTPYLTSTEKQAMKKERIIKLLVVLIIASVAINIIKAFGIKIPFLNQIPSKVSELINGEASDDSFNYFSNGEEGEDEYVKGKRKEIEKKAYEEAKNYSVGDKKIDRISVNTEEGSYEFSIGYDGKCYFSFYNISYEALIEEDTMLSFSTFIDSRFSDLKDMVLVEELKEFHSQEFINNDGKIFHTNPPANNIVINGQTVYPPKNMKTIIKYCKDTLAASEKEE